MAGTGRDETPEGDQGSVVEDTGGIGAAALEAGVVDQQAVLEDQIADDSDDPTA